MLDKIKDLNISWLDESIKKIDWLFWKLYISIEIEMQKELEFELYNFNNLLADISRQYIRNWKILQSEKDKKFVENRYKSNSDTMTTKKVNKDFQEYNTDLEFQEQIVEWCKKKQKGFERLANAINDFRINALAEAKRNVL